MYFLPPLPRQDTPLLFVGPTGTGTTSVTNRFLEQLQDPMKICVTCLINFSVRTTARQAQEIFLTQLEKQKEKVYGAPLGERAFVYVDDLNMPAKEKYGGQPPIELLRQWIDHRYWFDRKSTSAVLVKDASLAAANAPMVVEGMQ